METCHPRRTQLPPGRHLSMTCWRKISKHFNMNAPQKNFEVMIMFDRHVLPAPSFRGLEKPSSDGHPNFSRRWPWHSSEVGWDRSQTWGIQKSLPTRNLIKKSSQLLSKRTFKVCSQLLHRSPCLCIWSSHGVRHGWWNVWNAIKTRSNLEQRSKKVDLKFSNLLLKNVAARNGQWSAILFPKPHVKSLTPVKHNLQSVWHHHRCGRCKLKVMDRRAIVWDIVQKAEPGVGLLILLWLPV